MGLVHNRGRGGLFNRGTNKTVISTWTPLSLVATVISDTAINLTWTGGKLAKVERSTDGVNYTQIGTGTDTYSDTGLTEGTLYYYRVKGGGYSNIVSTYTFETEYSAIYAEMPDKPSVGVAQAQNGFVRDRKDSGVWAKLDKFLFFGTPLASQSLINWKNPGTLDPVLSGTPPTFTAYKGYTGIPASSTFINSKFIPSTHGVNYIQNSAGFGFIILNNKAAETGSTLSSARYSPGDLFMQLDTKISSTGNKLQNYNNCIATQGIYNIVNDDAYGFYHSNRTANNAGATFKDSTKTANSQISAGVSDLEVYALARNYKGTADRFSSDQIAALWYTSGLSDAEVADLRSGLWELLNYRDNRINIAGKTNRYFGNSITLGWDSYDTNQDWVSLLTAETATTKDNNGVSSMSLMTGHSPNFKAIYDAEIPVFDFDTDGLISFAFGVVDVVTGLYSNPSEFITDLDIIVDNAISKGWSKSRMIIHGASYCTAYDVAITALNTAIQNYCNSEGIAYYDPRTYMAEHGASTLLLDGVHPTDAGYAAYFAGLMREFKKWFIY